MLERFKVVLDHARRYTSVGLYLFMTSRPVPGPVRKICEFQAQARPVWAEPGLRAARLVQSAGARFSKNLRTNLGKT